MKTNHRRNFVEKNYSHRVIWGVTQKDRKAGISVSAWISNDFTDGHRGEARARRGGKHFVHSRFRCREKEYIRELLEDN